MKKIIRSMIDVVGGIVRHPRSSGLSAATISYQARGLEFGSQNGFGQSEAGESGLDYANPLAVYFEAHKTGPGLFKWEHYFEIYHRHLSKFVEREVHLLEVGIYSGGSLQMWRQYFGQDARIYGVDIEEACRAYETADTKIFIGDQSDRSLWERIKRKTPMLDVVIDDGGHLPEQQIATFEEILPHIRPGGVYICEDIHGLTNRFAAYVHGFSSNLHTAELVPDERKELSVRPSPAQTMIHSVHEYPFVVVIEINASARSNLRARRHGSDWQPFM